MTSAVNGAKNSYQRPPWDEYFMKIAEMVGSRGTCDRGRAGCVITRDKRIICTGYVGSPKGLAHCDEIGHEMHTIIHEDGHSTDHCIRTTHAEQNAICQAAQFGMSLQGATLYCKMTPCYTCAKMIINSGISRVVCAFDYQAGEQSKKIFKEAGVQFDLSNPTVLTYSDANNQIKDAGAEPQNKINQIFVYDEFSPEDTAMLQALYSRSPESVVKHVEKVKQAGSGKFMEKFYVGYGHKSIADCGSTTVFIEKISILADKAIQDWPLYSGQETSTRYVDMAKQQLIDPIGSADSKQILDDWMAFYINSQEKVQAHIKQNFPQKQEEDAALYEKAVKARCFDIMRGFLPAGITTQLSWHTNLRQAADKLSFLRHHPLTEVKQIAADISQKLKEKYPSSFSHRFYEEQENFLADAVRKNNFYQNDNAPKFLMTTSIRYFDLLDLTELLKSRPAKALLPHFLTEFGLLTFDFLLDFGSFRDIQRHRNGVCRMPLLTPKHGFNKWYLEQLPIEVMAQATELIAKQTERINKLTAADEIKQYYISLGFNVPCRVSYGLPATVYVIELRSGKTVHPTLRKIAHKMHCAVKEKFPFIALHSDLELDDWDVRRGKEDIVVK
jgi:deoxycytidylate deaminase/thymidylate synthase ThyX